jgi:hypothetical protein
MMKYLLQNNLLSDIFLEKVKDLHSKYPSILCEIIPFDNQISTKEPLEGLDYIPYGSSSMTRIGYKRGYTGVCFNENFKHSEYSKHHKSINNGVFNSEKAKKFLAENEGNWFIKPNRDAKNFTGFVDHSAHLIAFINDKMRYANSSGDYGITKDFEFVISKPVDIDLEVRWFVVDGKVIDGSVYKLGNGKHSENVFNNSEMVREAQSFADTWLPHKNVCMDLFLSEGELYLGEFNCINSSGFYDNDMDKIFESWFKSYNA